MSHWNTGTLIETESKLKHNIFQYINVVYLVLHLYFYNWQKDTIDSYVLITAIAGLI